MIHVIFYLYFTLTEAVFYPSVTFFPTLVTEEMLDPINMVTVDQFTENYL